ncbi:hypothetical protein GLOTRDRAFT_137694 [Gloeophyllum trabeum ATCC 11539]|uniref:FK506-binding protein n=1 Tax=Gloeophyllum trabeum (strain ATCC 11539 / FP-39264 / Madison 617) TaxID=670483 RepID=S7QDD8_GLOTA|nr:uncharacterized protein GLOTRDRAFT_137694 [Gloeophyllum trabeum ATCC 11539]EPQ57347.1 hypothetical protein GLOTRDRAFT_137694 [Gloeophyllum trabeum ATCC 11539]
MSIAVAVWSIALKPGQKETIIPLGDLKVTQAALGDELASEDKRTSVKVTYHTASRLDDDEDEDEEDETDPISTTVLCSLTPGKIEQATMDLVLEQELEYEFEVVGPNTVYLTGNYIDQNTNNVPYNDDSEPDSDEEGYDLRDVSSDVEIDPEDLDVPSTDEDRFEEVNEEEPTPALQNGKRARDSDAMETEEQSQEKLSKSQKKKLNKKLKAEGGKAVPAGQEPSPAKAEDKKASEGNQNKEKGKKDKSGGRGPVRTLEGGVTIQDAVVGTGPQVKKGSQVSLRYIGKLQDGTIFDKNTKGQPFKTTVGKGEVIKGWDVGLMGMQVGGERKIKIPPSMGYGNKKTGPIPANSVLEFEVKLIGMK